MSLRRDEWGLSLGFGCFWGLASGRVGPSARAAAWRARDMALFRRWAASGTGEGCNSTWNSASGFSCFRATYILDTFGGGAVEMPIDTPLL